MKAGEVLWTHELQTIPMPRIEALAGYDYLNLVIDQVNAFSFSISKLLCFVHFFKQNSATFTKSYIPRI